MTSETSVAGSERERLTATLHSEKRRRTELVGVRLTAEELAELKRIAAAHRMSVPELLRVSAFTLQTLEACRG